MSRFFNTPEFILYKSILIFITGFTFLLMLSVTSQSAEHPGTHQTDLERFRDSPSYKDTRIMNVPLNKLAKRQELTHEIFGYLPYWEYNSYSDLRYNLLTTIAYFSAEINSNGSISNDHHWPASSLISKAHTNGVKVVLCATLFDKTALGTLLSNQTYRTNCVNNLLTSVRQAGGDGVNIDFEGVPAAQRNNLVTFMQQLADSFRTYIPDAQISMASPAVDWSGAWDYNSLAGICDFLFIMGYDYYYSGSSTSGPNSPLTGGSYNITNTVNTYINAVGSGQTKKILLGIPYFGFEWPTESYTAKSNTTGKGSSIFYDGAETDAAQYGKNWHSASQTPWYCYYNMQYYQGWYDDSLSLALKYTFAKSKNLGGVGMWALGYDGARSELWDALASAFQTSAINTEPTVINTFNILPNYPNPANPGTIFPIIFNEESGFTVMIYDLNGKMIFSRSMNSSATHYNFYWNGLSDNEQAVSSGIYFLKIVSGQKSHTRKFSLLK